MRCHIYGVIVAGLCSVSAMHGQDVANPQHSSFATIGRPPVPTIAGGRLLDYTLDRLDRHPCCGYGKTLDDMGSPGTRATLIQYWGGSCEFFAENCRRSVPSNARTNGVQRFFGEMFGSGAGCNTCGK